MSMWRDQGTSKKDGTVATETPPPPDRPVTPEFLNSSAPLAAPAAMPAPPSTEAKESLIAADITIEGKIEGSGHVRLAGRFKGDVNVKGDLTIERNAKLNGGVRANKVIIAGELEGNIESAVQVELLASGALVGDVKAGSLTVAAGAKMRGQADFGWGDDKAGGKSAKSDSGAGDTSDA